MENNFTINNKFIETKPNEDELPKSDERKELIAALNKSTMFKGFCNKADKEGNLIVRYGNINCIMSRTEVSSVIEDDGNVHKGLTFNKVGTYINFNVIKVEDGVIYISRKSIVKKNRDYYNKNLKVGHVVEGLVTNINEKIGVYVDIGADYTALIPKGRLEHIYVSKITDHVNIGDKIKAVVKDLVKNDKDEFSDVILSRTEALPSYAEMTVDYQSGDTIIAKVKAIQPTAIYASINEHLDIMCQFPTDIVVTPGQTLRVRIKNVGQSRITGYIVSAL